MSYFSIGDVVTLKSGGPKMAVIYRSVGNEYVCIWYNNDNRIEKGTFPYVCLRGEEDEK